MSWGINDWYRWMDGLRYNWMVKRHVGLLDEGLSSIWFLKWGIWDVSCMMDYIEKTTVDLCRVQTWLLTRSERVITRFLNNINKGLRMTHTKHVICMVVEPYFCVLSYEHWLNNWVFMAICITFGINDSTLARIWRLIYNWMWWLEYDKICMW